MRHPARLENIRTLDPHSHAALTDLAPWLGPTREIHEPALLTVVGGKSSVMCMAKERQLEVEAGGLFEGGRFCGCAKRHGKRQGKGGAGWF